jgi:hypothetical protein
VSARRLPWLRRVALPAPPLVPFTAQAAARAARLFQPGMQLPGLLGALLRQLPRYESVRKVRCQNCSGGLEGRGGGKPQAHACDARQGYKLGASIMLLCQGSVSTKKQPLVCMQAALPRSRLAVHLKKAMCNSFAYQHHPCPSHQ